MDNVAREQALRLWIERECQQRIIDWRMISGDASFRRYFRYYNGERSIVAVDAPPERENVQGFLQLAKQLRQHGLMVPDLFAQNAEHGFWLLEDFGDTLLLHVLNQQTVHRYYTAAIDELLRFQSISAIENYVLPHYDQERFSVEVGLMPTWFLTAHLHYVMDASEQTLVQQTFDYLIKQALSQPVVLTHRDFHSRNLMVQHHSSRIGVIDFQDTVWGPVSYDLVSLLKDCYIAWPRATVLAMVEYYYRKAQSTPALAALNREQFIEYFDLMGLQRHIKVLGIFCRLYYRDGKSVYLADLPRVLHHAIEAAERYPQTQAFAQWLSECIAPRLLTQNNAAMTMSRVIN